MTYLAILAVTVSTFLLMFAIATLFFFIKKLSNLSSSQRWEEMIEIGYSRASQKVAEQSKQILSSERELIKTELDYKHKEIVKLVDDLNRLVEERQRELIETEKERAEQFGGLSKLISQQQKVTEQLRVSTEQLATVLTSNQARGQWGERIIEDLLTATGLQLNIHYRKQMMIDGTNLKPDISLLLPDDRLVAVDVKFPFSALHNWVNAENTNDKKMCLRKFSDDLKNHINKVEKYIRPETSTLDYAVIFVPNEAVFSFINQQVPEVVDYAFAKRVLLTSPFTFIIVARTIMESYRNYRLGDQLREVLKHLDSFASEWTKYQESLDKLGRAIKSVGNEWELLSTTRTKQLQRKVELVTDLGVKALPDVEIKNNVRVAN